MSDNPRINKKLYDLRKEWYAKLDESGFKDIERTGRLKATHYDPYGAILSSPDSVLRAKYTVEAFQHHQNLRNFSYVTRVTPNPHSQPIKITSNDRIILRMTGNGSTIAEISKHMRQRCKHKTAKRTSFSVFWVHTRLQYLINLMKTATYTEYSPKCKKDASSTCKTDATKDICNSRANDGGVQKKGF